MLTTTLDDAGYECCKYCGSYLYEEGGGYDNDTETEEEFGEGMSEAERKEFAGFAGNEDEQAVNDEYMFAKRRFRTFHRRMPRRHRFPRRTNWGFSMGKSKGKGRNKGNHGHQAHPFG